MPLTMPVQSSGTTEQREPARLAREIIPKDKYVDILFSIMADETSVSDVVSAELAPRMMSAPRKPMSRANASDRSPGTHAQSNSGRT